MSRTPTRAPPPVIVKHSRRTDCNSRDSYAFMTIYERRVEGNGLSVFNRTLEEHNQ